MRAILSTLIQAERTHPFATRVRITADAPALGAAVPSAERNAWSARLSALVGLGLLVKDDEMEPGRYGRPVCAFRLTAEGRVAAEAMDEDQR